jgi:hypothetical protein
MVSFAVSLLLPYFVPVQYMFFLPSPCVNIERPSSSGFTAHLFSSHTPAFAFTARECPLRNLILGLLSFRTLTAFQSPNLPVISHLLWTAYLSRSPNDAYPRPNESYDVQDVRFFIKSHIAFLSLSFFRKLPGVCNRLSIRLDPLRSCASSAQRVRAGSTFTPNGRLRNLSNLFTHPKRVQGSLRFLEETSTLKSQLRPITNQLFFG